MDRLTHMSLTNCIKELDALEKITLSGRYTPEQISDWIKQISWELSNVFRRKRYDSDELQFILRKIVSEDKEEHREPPTKDWRKDE